MANREVGGGNDIFGLWFSFIEHLKAPFDNLSKYIIVLIFRIENIFVPETVLTFLFTLNNKIIIFNKARIIWKTEKQTEETAKKQQIHKEYLKKWHKNIFIG